MPGTPTLGRGAGETRISLHTGFFPPLLPPEGAFSDIVDSLVREKISGSKPQDSQIGMILLGDQYAKHCSSRKSLNTKVYSYEGAYICIDVPTEEALSPALCTHRRSWSVPIF